RLGPLEARGADDVLVFPRFAARAHLGEHRQSLNQYSGHERRSQAVPRPRPITVQPPAHLLSSPAPGMPSCPRVDRAIRVLVLIWVITSARSTKRWTPSPRSSRC